MTEESGNRPRPTPRPRTASARPGPRPRVAGGRREREEPASAPAASDSTATPVAGDPATTGGSSVGGRRGTARPSGKRSAGAAAPGTDAPRRRVTALVLVLAVLCAAAATAVGVLLYQRLNPAYVDAGLLTSARSNVEALYAYDYEDSEGSVERKLAVLTGDLREQYETDLGQGGIIDTYEQVSATTRYEVLDVAVKTVNDAQDAATLVVFGQYVVQSANSGQQEAPQGSECSVTPEGAQSCVQTLRLEVVEEDGDWKISEVVLLTTS